MAGIRRPNGTSQRSVVDVRAVEILVGTARRRTPLALIMRAGALGAIRVLSGRAQLEEAHLSEDPRIQEMYRKINTLKNSEAVEADYMTAEEYKRRLQEEAEEKGKIRGEIQTQLDMLQVVMRKFGKTADEAMDMLEIAPERRESYKEKLQKMALQ